MTEEEYQLAMGVLMEKGARAVDQLRRIEMERREALISRTAAAFGA